MISTRRKNDKFRYDICWVILTTIISSIMVYFNYNSFFWTYSVVLYAFPIFMNLFFFLGIYDCFKDYEDFSDSFKRHFKVTEEQDLDGYYKGFNRAVLIIKGFCMFLIASTLFLLAVTLGFPQLLKNGMFRLMSYGIYYFIFLIGALVEKFMVKSFNSRIDKKNL